MILKNYKARYTNRITFIALMSFLFFLISFSLGSVVPQAMATSTQKKFIRIKIDSTDTGPFNNSQLYNFFAGGDSNGFSFDDFNITNGIYNATYVCGLALTEERGVLNDNDMILWTRKGIILGEGDSLEGDIGGGFYNCCNDNDGTKSDDPCQMTTDGGCTEDVLGTGSVFEKKYGKLDDDKCDNTDPSPCGSGNASTCCALSPDYSNAQYKFKNEALCDDNGNWNFCDDKNACASDGTYSYACNNVATRGTWENCTDQGKVCHNGSCQDTLFLTISPEKKKIELTKTETITFHVTKNGSNVVGAEVNEITASYGTTDSTTCTTDDTGECTVTYTAPNVSAIAIIGATKATKTGYIDSNSVSTNINVTTCIDPNRALYDEDSYNLGDTITLSGMNGFVDTFTDVDFSVCIYNPGGSLKADEAFNNTVPQSLDFVSDSTGIWKGLAVIGAGTCPDPFDANSGCVGSTEVIDTTPPPPPPPVCTPTAWSTWSACTNGSQTRTRVEGCGYPTSESQDCCTVANESTDCTTAPHLKCKQDPSPGSCVECLTNDDCTGTKVCNTTNNKCTDCKEDGTIADNPSLCCSGLNFVDGECTTKCDPNSTFFCNPLRNTVDTIIQGGQKMIGYILGIIGSVALLLIIISGIIYMTSAGVEAKITLAKRILTGSLIGLSIALLAFSLLQVVISVLNTV